VVVLLVAQLAIKLSLDLTLAEHSFPGKKKFPEHSTHLMLVEVVSYLIQLAFKEISGIAVQTPDLK
jgi:hypothetical protein